VADANERTMHIAPRRVLEVEDGLDVQVPHVSGKRQKNGWLMHGKAGAPRSFPVLWPRWQADVGCHEGKNGKKKKCLEL